MATGTRVKAGAQDLLLSMGFEAQQRQTGIYNIDGINATNIPFDATYTISTKIAAVEASITTPPVSSVFGRAGAVTAQSADYSSFYSLTTHNHTGVYEPANANIQSHIASTLNPHSVTAAQVGAYTTAQTDTLLSGKANTSHAHVVADITDYVVYTLPTASTTVLGGVKVDGTTITIAAGVISATTSSTTLDGLTDVTITTPANGQALIYETASSQWKNQTLVGGGDMLKATYDPTSINASAFVSSNHSIASGNIGNSTVTATAITNIDSALSDTIDTGFISWGGAGAYWSTNEPTGEITILRSGTGRIKGKLISWSAPQTIALTGDAGNYIYINSSGAIGTTTTLSDALYQDNILLLEAYRVLSSGLILPIKENHNYNFETGVSRYIHNVIGTVFRGGTFDLVRVTTGTGAATTDREVKVVGSDHLDDHGLITDIVDSAGAAISMFFAYKNGLGIWQSAGFQTQMLMQYNNAGTPTSIPLGDRGIFRVYAAKDGLNTTTPTYFAVMDITTYGGAGAANTAIANNTPAVCDGEFLKLEPAQVGFIVVLNNSSGGYISLITMSRRTLNANTTGGSLSNLATGIITDTTLFNGYLSAADSNVQLALDTLDNHTQTAVTGGTGQTTYATGDILYASATNTLSKLAAGTNGYVLTLAGGVPTWAVGGAGSFSPTIATPIASAATITLSAAGAGNTVHITGTTTITSLGNATAGVWVHVIFDGALILTHNATSLMLPTAANITTAAGDSAVFLCDSTNNWKCIDYQRASGQALVATSDTNPLGDWSQILYCKFNNSLADEMGAYTLTNNSLSYTTGGGGVEGEAITSITATQYASISPSINLVGKTLVFRAKRISTNMYINEPDATQYIRLTSTDGGAAYPIFANSTNISGTNTGIACATASYDHFAIVFVNTTNGTLIYRNGVLVFTSVAAVGATFTFASIGPAFADALGGNIDKLRVFNRVLTATEISSLYTGGY